MVTQNIDGLHQVAGSKNVLELHGNIWRVRCTGCGAVVEDRRVPLPELPACVCCGASLRPDVIWFGEMLDPQVLESAYEAALNCGVMLVVGTSGVVQPAASMGMNAKSRGAYVVEINLEPTPYTGSYHLSILGKSGDIVPALL
jgi:NAD-dependent deacetylase